MSVFLSYNRADVSAIHAVREALLARGIETFVDWNAYLLIIRAYTTATQRPK